MSFCDPVIDVLSDPFNVNESKPVELIIDETEWIRITTTKRLSVM